MIYANDIPYNKVFKRKVTLPISQGAMNKYNLVLMCTNNLNSAIKLMTNHPMITSNGRYKQYYMDTIYRDKIGTKRIVQNLRAERKDIYERIGKETNITPVMKYEGLMDKNTFFDLTVYNNNFFDNIPSKATLLSRAKVYFEYIKEKILDSRFNNFKSRMVFIDITSFSGDENPLSYFYVILKKEFETLKSLETVDLYFYTDEMILRFDVKSVEKNTHVKFKTELNKMTKSIVLPEEEDDNSYTEEEIVKPTVSKSDDLSRKNVDALDYNNDEDIENVEDNSDVDVIDDPEEDTSGDSLSDDTLLDTEDAIEDSEDIEETSKKETSLIDTNELSDTDLDDELLSAMQSVTSLRHRDRVATEREARLAKNQEVVKFDDVEIKEWVKPKASDYVIEDFDVSNKVVTTNKNVKNIKYANFDKAYNDKMMKKDTMRILTSLNDKDLPVYIKNIKCEDTSDELNYKETYTVTLEDGNGVRHTLKFDMPKFIDNSFMYIGGNKKIINTQLFLLPVLKTGPDEVQIVTNYNKIFLRRFGNKMSPETERFKKFLSEPTDGLAITYGNCATINTKYKTTLDYDVISEKIVSVKSKKALIMFDQDEIHERMRANEIEPNKDFMCIGFYKDGKPIYFDLNREIGVDTTTDMISTIVSALGVDDKFEATSSTGKRFMYTRVKIMHREVPIVILLGYCEGLSTVLRKGKVNHYFTDKRPRVDSDKGVVQFSDGYLVYDKYPYQNSLLMNAFDSIPTKAYSYTDMDEPDAYIDIFDSLYNSRNLANAFDTFYEFMIDPITKEILQDLKYPTDFVSLVLFANSLLADNSYDSELDLNNVRARTNEIVNAILYKHISDAYARYRTTSANRNPIKISIPRDAVIKDILAQPTVEDYSTLNPIYESTKTRIASLKGLNGLNLPDSYNENMRAYDKTMVGTIGISTSPDRNVGVQRYLTLEPSFTGVRGYVNTNNDNKDVNMFTPGELLTPGCVTRDDSPRVSMASKQSTHIVPVTKSSPVLISNGVEQTIQYYLSSDFTVIADEDGEVVERDDNIGIVVVKYKSGKCRAVDIKPHVVKNASSGFYLTNTLRCDLKVGDKVKAKDIIAYEDKFFTNDGFNGNRFNIGSLQKVAIMSSYATFEDSSFVTKKISEDMSSDIVMMKDVTIGANANISNCVKIGDRVEVGDSLISFETSHEDDVINKMLASVGDDLQEDIKSLGRVTAKTKYAGVIQDIKIYSTVDLEEMSPSLRALVSSYWNKINKKKKLVSKYDKTDSVVKAGMLFNETTGKISPTADGKIKGRDVFDGVLIEFYIKYHDALGVGDKLTYFSALKSTVGEVIDEGYEPYSEFRPDEEVSAFIAPLAVLARQVPSTITTMLGNKVLVELKRKLKDIYEE